MSNDQQPMFQPNLPTQFVYAVFDSKMLAYRDLFVAANDAVAERIITRAVINPDHDFALHPQDFALMRLGEWNPGDGLLAPIEAPKCVTTLQELRAKIEAQARFLQGVE